MFISMQILIFHPMLNVNIFAYSQSFGGSVVPRSADPQFRNTRWSVLLSNEVEVEEKKRKLNVQSRQEV